MKHGINRHARLSVGTGALLVLAGCTQVKPGPDFERARGLIEQSTGFDEVYDPQGPALSEEEISAWLQDGLSLDEAVRLALLNNRTLQAEFMSIGVAKADWVQSGLLVNPTLDMLFRFPLDGGRSQIEALFVQNILEFWRIPVRKEISQRVLDETVLRIARRAGDLVADTRIAYYQAVAQAELHRSALENLTSISESHDAVRSLREAGAASRFDESLARAPLVRARLAVRVAEFNARDAKRRLAQRLSLEADMDGIALVDPLPEPLPVGSDAEAFVGQARESRLDLRAYRKALEAAASQIKLESGKSFGDLSVGVALERPPISGDALVGPAFTATVPIFDQNQAQIARAEYLYAKAVKTYEALELDVAQQVRAAADRAMTASSNLAFYREELLPQAEESLRFASDSYAAGQTSVIAMLEGQRIFLEARTGFIEVRREAVSALADLERAMGVPLKDIQPQR